ncbi:MULTISPECIES: biopolymer transporter ExbD [unclassified Neisseria]|uniref:ExbD/TolR family protein n=1 Tax=unclassified Neisseria TaxID=2623750 RepID=UPI001071E5BA|nr:MULTISPECIES: biopolymer transporter ExbD [unclassified Neisseria]MBF0804054.1 biopolymer transporter ExbD [Neisseria sp. 19428wB4_WF04]TFU43195.1 biopolymer transporter ExbD [Neisseria sp. WF04]
MAFGSMNSGDDAPMADINVTPLVDVMLVLLIVFMITMPVLTHSIPLQLPTASENIKQETQPKEPLRLSIDADGAYVLGAESTTKLGLEEITEQLKQAKAENADLIVAIAADKRVEYDSVAQALHSAREAGISKIGFITETDSGR